MSDTRERLMAAFRPGKGPTSKTDALLDAMREVAQEKDDAAKAAIAVVIHDRCAALEQRVAALDHKLQGLGLGQDHTEQRVAALEQHIHETDDIAYAAAKGCGEMEVNEIPALEQRVAEMDKRWATTQLPCGCYLNGSGVCADHGGTAARDMSSDDRASEHRDRGTGAPPVQPAPAPAVRVWGPDGKGQANGANAPAPEPSEEALDAIIEAHWPQKLPFSRDRLRWILRAAYAVDLPHLEREAGEQRDALRELLWGLYEHVYGHRQAET